MSHYIINAIGEDDVAALFALDVDDYSSQYRSILEIFEAIRKAISEWARTPDGQKTVEAVEETVGSFNWGDLTQDDLTRIDMPPGIIITKIPSPQVIIVDHDEILV